MIFGGANPTKKRVVAEVGFELMLTQIHGLVSGGFQRVRFGVFG